MRTAATIFIGRPERAGMSRWGLHVGVFVAMLLIRTVADGLGTVARLVELQSGSVPAYLTGAGTLAHVLFWPTVLLAAYLLAATVPARVRASLRER